MSKWTERWDEHQCYRGNKIIRYHALNRFFSCVSHAERGMGKSMLDIQTMAYIYWWAVEKNETLAWQYALDNMLFQPTQLEKLIDKNEEDDTKSLVWCLDDAAVHFGNKLWWTDQGEAILLESTFELIRPVVAGLLINCTQKERLLNSLQHYDDYDATLYTRSEHGNDYDRKMILLHWYKTPAGDKRYDKVNEENFSVIVPDWVYENYNDTRKQYIKIIREKQKKYRDKQMGILSTNSESEEEF